MGNTGVPSIKSILQGGNDVAGKYIPDPEVLGRLVQQLRDGDFTIGLTQGVYDMFHPGHGKYLRQAKSFADVLIVGVDSDELTRSMKGPDRPFDSFEERIDLLSMLSFVNIIARRDVGQHMYDLIRLVRPDVLVMSKTTKTFGQEDIDALKGYYGRIEYLEAQSSNSTTAKMRRLHGEGARKLGERITRAVQETLDEILGGDGQ